MNLEKVQRETLERVVSLSLTEGFYLAGGTALAIKYSHRPSQDFDFFTYPSEKFRISSMIGKLHLLPAEVASMRDDTLIFLVEGVRFSFFKYSYPLLEEPVLWKDLNIFIAGDRDIACMKALAIAQRGSKKDFFDLWFLMNKRGITLQGLLKDLEKKYSGYNPGIFLKALTFFEDAEKETNEYVEPFWEDIKRFMVSLLRELSHDSYLSSEPFR